MSKVVDCICSQPIPQKGTAPRHMRRIKTAVIGAGFMGKVHSEAIRRLGNVEIAAVAAVDDAEASGFGKAIGVERTTGDYTTVLNDREIEADNAAFLQELAKLGWTVGRNLQIDARVRGDYTRLHADAAEMVGKAPDVLVTQGTAVTAMSKRETSTIPIVFVNVADPVASGFAASFARPGGNITGFTSLEYSFAGKWLSVLKDIVPSISRVMVRSSQRSHR